MIDPHGRAPAPGSLRLVQEFVNTLDVEDERDLLADRHALSAWSREHGVAIPGPGPSDHDVAKVSDLREALRGLLRANATGDPDPGAAAFVNRLSARAPVRVELGADGAATLRGAAGTGVEAALAAILAAAGTAMLDGSWPRLKACVDPGCGWAFYDRSRNRSGQWCDMAVCGSRHKVRAYRSRQANR